MQRHWQAVALCRKAGNRVHYDAPAGHQLRGLRGATHLRWRRAELPPATATLNMILRTKEGLPELRRLDLDNDAQLGRNVISAEAMHALCTGLGPGDAPSLRALGLSGNHIGPAGAGALAAALGRGALPSLSELDLDGPIGNRGVAALAVPLRTMPVLRQLVLVGCGLGDEGVASLVANLRRGDFGALEFLNLRDNGITDAGCATLARALAAEFPAGGVAFPALHTVCVAGNPASEAAEDAVLEAHGAGREAVIGAFRALLA